MADLERGVGKEESFAELFKDTKVPENILTDKGDVSAESTHVHVGSTEVLSSMLEFPV